MKAHFNKYTKEVEESLSHLSLNYPKEKAEKLRSYLGTNLRVYGLTSKQQTEINKTGFSFYNSDKSAMFEVFDHIFKKSPTHEGKNQALIFLDRNYQHIEARQQLELLPQWITHVDNWAHSDYLSKFLTRLLEHPETRQQMLKLVKLWNNSEKSWERRQSLVSLYYYARTKKEHIPFDLSKKHLQKLMQDKDYFVQKAVGWTLRESFNVYPEFTFEFIERHIKQISSTAFTTAIEKMSLTQKNYLKSKRK